MVNLPIYNKLKKQNLPDAWKLHETYLLKQVVFLNYVTKQEKKLVSTIYWIKKRKNKITLLHVYYINKSVLKIISHSLAAYDTV